MGLSRLIDLDFKMQFGSGLLNQQKVFSPGEGDSYSATAARLDGPQVLGKLKPDS